MSVGRFYAMVGALLRRLSDGKYLVLRRSEEVDFASGLKRSERCPPLAC